VTLDLMDGEETIWEGHPSWRAVLSHLTKGILGSIAFIVVLVVIDKLGAPSSFTTWGIILGVVGIGITILVAYLERVFTLYTITNTRINTRTGVLSKREASTSLDRIQNVTITQDLLDRILRTGTVDFDTASMDSSDKFRFFGINTPQRVREQIQRAQEQRKQQDASSPV
jgi:uncharacterized membrane protein YdbT with pleckstrin-like domain